MSLCLLRIGNVPSTERLRYALCATRSTDVFRLGAKVGVDPMELLQMIKGKMVPIRTVFSGLAKELHSNVSLLTNLGCRNQTLTRAKHWP
jgi:hypothetical protein